MKVVNRIKSAVKAFYEGAQFRIFRSQIPGNQPQSARLDITKWVRLELQRRSRQFEKNDPLCNRMADLFEQFTVGTGLQYFPNSSDKEWNARFQKKWNQWTKYPEVDSKRCFEATQGLIAWRWWWDGEIFIIKTRGETGRPRIQLIEAQRCATPPEMAAQEGITIFDGVEIDSRGRHIAYWFTVGDRIGDELKWRRVDAEFVIHIFEATRPGQTRGLPFLTPSIPENHDLNDLHLLEMKAAKEAARRANVIKNAAGEVTDEDVLRKDTTVGTQDSQGTATEEVRKRLIQDALGGETIFLKDGEEFEQTQNNRPSVVQQEYWQYKTALVCAGGGIPKEIALHSDLNGPSVRGVYDIASGWFKIRSGTLIYLLGYVYEFVAQWEIDNDPQLRNAPEDWRVFNCRPPRAINIDVGRNSAAKIAELEAGLGDWEDAWGELGQDAKLKLRRKAEYVRYIDDLGKEFQIEPHRIANFPNEPKEDVGNVKTSADDTEE